MTNNELKRPLNVFQVERLRTQALQTIKNSFASAQFYGPSDCDTKTVLKSILSTPWVIRFPLAVFVQRPP